MIVLGAAEVLRKPSAEANGNKDSEEGDEDSYDPKIGALTSV